MEVPKPQSCEGVCVWLIGAPGWSVSAEQSEDPPAPDRCLGLSPQGTGLSGPAVQPADVEIEAQRNFKSRAGMVWVTPTISALWKMEAEGSLEDRGLRPA